MDTAPQSAGSLIPYSSFASLSGDSIRPFHEKYNASTFHQIKYEKSLLIESAEKVSVNNEMFLTNLPISPAERELWYNFIE